MIAPQIEVETSLSELSRLAAQASVSLAEPIRHAAALILETLSNGGKILACGNGGSAADAQHFAAEFVGRFLRERRAMPAISLSSDPSVNTALGNDYGVERMFSRQVEAFGRPGDVLVVISTSGRSGNILEAAKAARERQIAVIALTGRHADPALRESAVWLNVNSTETPRIQEIHMALLHAMCQIVELSLPN